MATVNTYLNFSYRTEEAFEFYKSIFGGEFESMSRFGEMPPQAGMPPLSDSDQQLIMHVTLPILGGHRLMGSDVPKGMAAPVKVGNIFKINHNPDSREETDRFFNALSEGGEVRMHLQDMFWEAYYGSCTDKFGVRWMFNFTR